MSRYTDTGVDDVLTDSGRRLEAVYDLQGRLYAAADVPSLPAGVYVMRYDDGTAVKKVLTR